MDKMTCEDKVRALEKIDIEKGDAFNETLTDEQKPMYRELMKEVLALMFHNDLSTLLADRMKEDKQAVEQLLKEVSENND